MSRLLLLLAGLVAPTAALASADATLFMCKFGDTVDGTERPESQLFVMVEKSGDGSLNVRSADPANLMQGGQLSWLEGDLNSDAGDRQFALITDKDHQQQFLLTMGSKRGETQFFKDGIEVLIGMLGNVKAKDPRIGNCAMMQGDVLETFEAFKRGELSR